MADRSLQSDGRSCSDLSAVDMQSRSHLQMIKIYERLDGVSALRDHPFDRSDSHIPWRLKEEGDGNSILVTTMDDSMVCRLVSV